MLFRSTSKPSTGTCWEAEKESELSLTPRPTTTANEEAGSTLACAAAVCCANATAAAVACAMAPVGSVKLSESAVRTIKLNAASQPRKFTLFLVDLLAKLVLQEELELSRLVVPRLRLCAQRRLNRADSAKQKSALTALLWSSLAIDGPGADIVVSCSNTHTHRNIDVIERYCPRGRRGTRCGMHLSASAPPYA